MEAPGHGLLFIIEAFLGIGSYVLRLIFKPFRVAISEGLHVAVEISFKAQMRSPET